MAEPARKTIGESTPVTIGLVIAVITVAIGAGKALNDIGTLKEQAAEGRAFQAKYAEDRLNLEHRLSGIESEVQETHRAVDRLVRYFERDADVHTAGGRVPR